MKLSASIVLYKTDPKILELAIATFLGHTNDANRTLYLVDNSPTDQLRTIGDTDSRIVYISNPSNPGFGAAHNLALSLAIQSKNDYHFVINPDVSAKDDVVQTIVAYMEENKDVGMCMPRILNSDGSPQYLPKLLPSPYSIVMRKLKYPKKLYHQFIDSYELRKVESDKIYEAPVLSGCFTVFRVSALAEVGVYDDRFFMYFEDWDISRRMNRCYKTVYFPKASIFHDYESGANHNRRLLKIFIKSAIYYFNKWGWFFDKERKRINDLTLSQFK